MGVVGWGAAGAEGGLHMCMCVRRGLNSKCLRAVYVIYIVKSVKSVRINIIIRTPPPPRFRVLLFASTRARRHARRVVYVNKYNILLCL